MMAFLYYILCVFGLTHILVSSKIMGGFRNWLLVKFPFIGEMLECYQCTSFWASMFLYFFFNDLNLNTPPLSIFSLDLNLNFLFFSFIGSGVVSFIALMMSLLTTLIKKTK